METTRKDIRSKRTRNENPQTREVFEVKLAGRRHANAKRNSLQFLAEIEGVHDYDGTVRSANGIRWRVS